MSVDFSFHYNFGEDRLAILATEQQGPTAVLWMTRSLTAKFLNALATMISGRSTLARRASGQSSDILAFERERALVEVTGSAETQIAPSQLPTEVAPKLVRSIDLRPLPDQQVQIGFLAEGARLNLVLAHSALHVTYAHIEALAARAEWNLQLVKPWATAAPEAGQGPGKLTH